MGLLRTLRPQWWFSAHLHTRFEATVTHESTLEAEQNAVLAPVEGTNPDEIAIDDIDGGGHVQATIGARHTPVASPPANPDEIKLDDEEDRVVAPPPPLHRRETKFLALDKCLPRRRFLEVSIRFRYIQTTRHDTRCLPDC